LASDIRLPLLEETVVSIILFRVVQVKALMMHGSVHVH
jgi:hypothetical protein